MPRIAVAVCSRDRVELLEQALASIDVAARRVAGEVEVAAIDNGSSDATPAMLARWRDAGPGRETMRVTGTGKSGALNQYLRQCRAEIIAFTDDDVVVDPDWLAALERFFTAHPEVAAAAGPIRLPPDVVDPDLLRRVRLYPTLPYWEVPPDTVLTQLLGANMAVRRSAFERVGPFDPRLGPGATGLGEETDLARRLLAAGLRIGYAPGAVVYHVIVEHRLTLAAFCAQQEKVALSRFLMRGGRESRLALRLRLAEAWIAALAAAAAGNEARRVRARGRVAFYSALLRLTAAGRPPAAE